LLFVSCIVSVKRCKNYDELLLLIFTSELRMGMPAIFKPALNQTNIDTDIEKDNSISIERL
jgi:hypothetical protein